MALALEQRRPVRVRNSAAGIRAQAFRVRAEYHRWWLDLPSVWFWLAPPFHSYQLRRNAMSESPTRRPFHRLALLARAKSFVFISWVPWVGHICQMSWVRAVQRVTCFRLQNVTVILSAVFFEFPFVSLCDGRRLRSGVGSNTPASRRRRSLPAVVALLLLVVAGIAP